MLKGTEPGWHAGIYPGSAYSVLRQSAVKTTDQSESSGNRKEHIDEIPETHSAKTW